MKKTFFQSKKCIAYAIAVGLVVLCVAANLAASILKGVAPVSDSVLTVLVTAIPSGLAVLLHAQGKVDVAMLEPTHGQAKDVLRQ